MTGTIFSHRWHTTGELPRQNRGVYLLHGIGEHGGRYHRFASYLTSLGYEVAAHDHPGHGKSAGKRGVIFSDDELVDAAIEQFLAFKEETGATPILFGHSMGGLVASQMVLDKKLDVSGLILSAPAFSPFISPLNKFKLRLLEIIAPRFAQELPYDAANLTHDKHEQELGRNDPLNHRFKSASLVGWIVRAGRQAIDSAASLDTPTLILIPGSDVVVDKIQTQHFVDRAPADTLTVHHYEHYLHEVLNESVERRDQVTADIGKWLADQT